MRRFIWVFLLLMASLLPLTAASAGQQTTDRDVTGSVLNAEGQAVNGAIVVLESVTDTKQSKTGSDGKFTFANVPLGPYHLSARADGFLPARVEVTITTATAPIQITLTTQLHFREVVSVSPDSRSQFESYQPTSVLGGQELARQLQSTIGATLADEPGVSTRSFGPGPARPVIRGFDGDRVLVLTDGRRMGDLSSQSGDHGVNVNPASASTIEVVRGPATLLYGANAIGGLVNVITRTIPTAPVRGAKGSITFDAGSAASEGGGAGGVTVGNGRVALHLAGTGRRAGDYETPEGAVPNSFSRGGSFEGGISSTHENGYVGASFGYDKTHYGIPFVEAGETSIDPRRKLFDVRAERRNLSGFLNSFRASVGVRRYRHDELDAGEVATAFTNNTSEFEGMFGHRQAGRLKGTFGVWGMTRRFLAEGEEALSPEVRQKGVAAFLYEEASVTPHVSIQFGGRVERAMFTPAEDFAAREFTNISGSAGLLVHPNDQTTVAVSVARSERNPAIEELYFHGPHPGNNAIENGDDALTSERGLGVDLSFRLQFPRVSGEVTAFTNRVRDFIFRQLTGEIDDEDGLLVTFFAQGDATVTGVESHVDVQIAKYAWLEGGVDYVRGELTAIGSPLPRMPPLRGRLGIRIQRNAFQVGVDTITSARQDRVFVTEGVDGPVGETTTDGYTTAKIYVAYSFAKGRTTSTIALRIDNAGNTLYHNHLNFLKDLAPEVGRNVKVVYTAGF